MNGDPRTECPECGAHIRLDRPISRGVDADADGLFIAHDAFCSVCCGISRLVFRLAEVEVEAAAGV